MAYVDHLKNNLIRTIARAYGRHVGTGVPTMSYSDGTDVTIRQALCDGEIESVEGIWYEGANIDSADYTLYNGSQTTAPAAPFAEDDPHTGTAMLTIAIAALSDPDNYTNPPNAAAVIGKYLKVKDYDSAGAEISSGAKSYSVNGARVVADLIHNKGEEPLTKTDWDRFCDWRDFMDGTEIVDYSTILDYKGLGLTGSYYSDNTLSTFVLKRTDPVVYFASSYGAPALGIPDNNFSVRWEGKIKTKDAGSYLFTVIHDDGVKVFIDDLGTPIIDNWATATTDSSSISLSGDTFYNIKIEFKGETPPNGIEFKWTPPGESIAVVPQEYLYPTAAYAPLYETHALFENPTSPNEGMRHVLAMCNSIVQQADGKRKFYCIDELTSSSFDFDESNIKLATFKFYRRDLRSLITRYEGVFRDLDSRYLEVANPAEVVEYPDLQIGDIPASIQVDLDSMTHWQARKVLQHLGKRETEMDLICEFDGTKLTFPVLPGDVVTITHPLAGWTAKTFLVLETIDYSPETTPDRRGFTCLEWSL